MKGNSNSKKTTEEKKNEKKMTNADLMQFLGKYDSIIKDKMISDNAKKVLSCLLYVGSKQNESFTIGQRTISELTGVAKNKISANIAILVDKGFINCNVGERGKNSEYSINYEAMKSYVSLSVPKCTEKVSQVSQSVPSVPNNEGTVKRTVEETPKDAEIQRVMERIEVYQKCINEELGTLKKIILGDININNNINLKDNILNNDNTEEYNTRYQEKKKNISTGNLEKLKENSNDEIFNDEDIQRENESLNEIENTSKDKLLDNENLNESRISDLVDMYFNQTNIPNDNIPSESRIPSEDNISTDENPNDMPPLDVDCFFEDSNSTEYRNNENLNESRIPSEDGRIETTDNISNDENSKADEIDCSVFGNETFDSDTISKTQNLVPRCVDGRFVVVEDNISNNENSKNNNLKTSENMKKTKISKGEISNKSNISNSFIHFGRLVGVCDMKGNVEEYLFNAYDTLKTADDFSEKFTETTEITIDLTQLEVSQDCGSGVWGMLSFNNGEYSFTQSNVNTHYSEKVTQSCAAETDGKATETVYADENTDEVDNHTTNEEITAGNTLKMRPEPSDDNNDTTADNKNDENTVESPSEDTPKTEIPSEGNNDTTANDKDDEKAIETVYADEKNTEVDSNTTDKEITAGNSVKIRPEASDEKIDTTAEWNNIELFIITSYRTVRSLIEELCEIPVTNLESFSLAYSPLDYQMTHKYKQTMTSDEWNSFANTLKNVTDRFFRHWAEVFSTRQPSSNFYEQQMYGLVQNNHQQSTATVNDTSNNGIQASISSNVGNNTTDTKKAAPVQSQNANKQSENNAAPLPNSIKAWEKVNIYSHIDKKTYTMNEGFDIYKSLAAKDIHSIMTWMKDFCDTMRMAKDNNIITEEQFNDFHNVFNALSRGKKKYWYNAFSNREPRKTMTSEMQMWEYLGRPKVNKADNKTVDNNKVYEDNVILPTHKDFETMNLDEIKNTLLTFVAEHPNLSDDKKAYINDLCIAYTLEPQYVA